MQIEVPVGDVVDKITILQIKQRRITDAGRKRENVERELHALRTAWNTSGLPWPTAKAEELQGINEALWDVEDELRRHEVRGDFGEMFVRRARSVYQINDRRAKVKREINALTGSELVEEKDYVAY